MAEQGFKGFFDRRVWKFSENLTTVRLIGETTSVFEFWIPISTASGKHMRVYKFCLCWDATKKRRAGTCPYCQADLRGRPVHYTNAIIRELQERNIRSPAQSTPLWIRVVTLPPRLDDMLNSLAVLNKQRTKSGEWKAYPLAHPKRGCDIEISVNPTHPYGYYDARLVEHSRLSAQERAYPLVPLQIKLETLEQAKVELRRLKKMLVTDQREDHKTK